MLDEIKKKHQIYVIAPLIEQSDKIDLENIYKLEEKMKKEPAAKKAPAKKTTTKKAAK